jgi:outer membrane protein
LIAINRFARHWEIYGGAGFEVGRGPRASRDAKRYFVGTSARWYAGATKVIETEHDLDPWVLSAGLGMRF